MRHCFQCFRNIKVNSVSQSDPLISFLHLLKNVCYYTRLFIWKQIDYQSSEADLRGAARTPRPPPPLSYYLQSLDFWNHFEELQTMLFTVEMIINNAPLTYVYLNTVETCLTPNYLFLADSYYNLLTQHQL